MREFFVRGCEQLAQCAEFHMQKFTHTSNLIANYSFLLLIVFILSSLFIPSFLSFCFVFLLVVCVCFFLLSRFNEVFLSCLISYKQVLLPVVTCRIGFFH